MNKLIVETVKVAGKAALEMTALTAGVIVGMSAGMRVADVTIGTAKRIPGALRKVKNAIVSGKDKVVAEKNKATKFVASKVKNPLSKKVEAPKSAAKPKPKAKPKSKAKPKAPPAAAKKKTSKPQAKSKPEITQKVVEALAAA
jgi:outer membrane biosynthesis protein TonB